MLLSQRPIRYQDTRIELNPETVTLFRKQSGDPLLVLPRRVVAAYMQPHQAMWAAYVEEFDRTFEAGVIRGKLV